MASGLHTRRYLGNAVSLDTAHPARGDPLELLVLLGGVSGGTARSPSGVPASPRPLCSWVKAKSRRAPRAVYRQVPGSGTRPPSETPLWVQQLKRSRD